LSPGDTWVSQAMTGGERLYFITPKTLQKKHAGPHECGGRARTASRRAPQCGARVLPRSPPAGAAPGRGGEPAGGKGVHAVALR